MYYLPDNPALWALLFMMGAAIGSFLNVVIYRWPQQESVLRPPSHCMSCGARLGFIDLIPVFSYVLLRGRCRHCGRRFSPRYAVVELATGLLLLGSVYFFGAWWQAAAAFVICCCLLVACLIDLDHMIIPDELVVIIALVGVALNVYDLARNGAVGTDGTSYALAFTQEVGGSVRVLFLPVSLVGMVGGAAFFLLVAWVSEKAFGKPAMGMGDVKLAGAMGAVFGPGYVFAAWFLISVVVGAAVSLILLGTGVRKRRDYIPFGPMLALGGIVLVLFPEVAGYVIGLYGG